MFQRLCFTVVLAAVLLIAGQARAALVLTPIDVGTGASTADIEIQWADNYTEVYAVHFEGTITGLAAIQLIDAQVGTFSADIQSFFFGDFVNGLTSGAHTNSGFSIDSEFWAYWTKSVESDPWTSSIVGASDRNLVDGNWDGWYYSTGIAEPQAVSLVAIPEPVSFAVLGVTGLLLSGRRGSRVGRACN